MKKLDRFNNFCMLLSRLDVKNQELREAKNNVGKLTYEVDSLNKQLSQFEDIKNLKSQEIDSIKRFRMRNCLTSTAHFAEGGSIEENPLSEFKKSEDFKSFTPHEKKLFKTVEPFLLEQQYNIENAVIIGQNDDDDFDVYESSVIEDYIDETMEQTSEYEQTSIPDLRKLKEIMYKFVEQVSK